MSKPPAHFIRKLQTKLPQLHPDQIQRMATNLWRLRVGVIQATKST